MLVHFESQWFRCSPENLQLSQTCGACCTFRQWCLLACSNPNKKSSLPHQGRADPRHNSLVSSWWFHTQTSSPSKLELSRLMHIPVGPKAAADIVWIWKWLWILLGDTGQIHTNSCLSTTCRDCTGLDHSTVWRCSLQTKSFGPRSHPWRWRWRRLFLTWSCRGSA